MKRVILSLVLFFASLNVYAQIGMVASQVNDVMNERTTSSMPDINLPQKPKKGGGLIASATGERQLFILGDGAWMYMNFLKIPANTRIPFESSNISIIYDYNVVKDPMFKSTKGMAIRLVRMILGKNLYIDNESTMARTWNLKEPNNCVYAIFLNEKGELLYKWEVKKLDIWGTSAGYRELESLYQKYIGPLKEKK